MLGQILRKVGRAPVPELLQKNIFGELGLDETSMRADSFTPAPVMHAYGSERGVYEDETAWTLNWIRGAGNVISTVDDLGVWADALGTGSLVSPRLHALQVGDQNVGLGTNTEAFHYAMGSGVTNGWIYNNPHILGYKGVVSYLPGEGRRDRDRHDRSSRRRRPDALRRADLQPDRQGPRAGPAAAALPPRALPGDLTGRRAVR